MTDDDAAIEALDAFVEALLAGEVTDADEWLARNPGLDEALRADLDVVASLHRAADSVAQDSILAEPASASEELADTVLADGRPSAGGSRRLLAPGTRVGECVIEELIGTGGMGEVYRAHHAVLGRDVSVKVLRPFLADDPDAVARFRREVQAQASMGAHPNVVTATHASEHEGRLYLVMEHVAGRDLARLVRAEGPLEPARAADLIRQAAAGLAHAHAAGIVHRDVKPSNLLLTEDGVVKVVDLGLARLAQGERTDRRSWVDELVGSLDYMAPEQADRPDDADARSDLYGLGCTLYFLLEGRPPFADRLSLKKLMAHAVDPPPPLSRAVPTGLQTILLRLLEKSPDDRYASAEELVEALEASAPVSSTSTTRSAARTREPSNTAPPRRALANLGWIVAGFFALAVTVFGLAFHDDPPSAFTASEPLVGALEASDSRRPKERAPFDTHPFAVETGATYAFTLRSRAFDPVLLLRADGWEVETNDDAPGLGTSSQVIWTADRTGEIELVATTSREEAAGDYLLSATEVPYPQLEVGATLDGTLDESDEHYHGDDSLLDRFWLKAEAGQTYVLRMRARGYRPFLFLESDDARMLTGGVPVEGAPEEIQLVHVAEEAGFLIVCANAAEPGEGGAYHLSVASELAGEEILHTSGILSEGDAVAGDESFYDPHPIAMRAGHTYVITMRSEDFDTYLLLVDSADARIARNDDALGTDSRLVYTAREDAEMRIFANSYTSGMSGQYTLTARELPPQ